MNIYASIAAVSDYRGASQQNVADVRRLITVANVIALFLVPLLAVTVPTTLLVQQ